MMYSEMYERAQREHAVESVNVNFWKPEKGDHIVGRLAFIEDYQGDNMMEPCKRYTIETDEGAQSVLLGSATDKKLDGKLAEGLIVSIGFGGKIPIKGGRQQCNIWSIQIIPEYQEEPSLPGIDNEQ